MSPLVPGLHLATLDIPVEEVANENNFLSYILEKHGPVTSGGPANHGAYIDHYFDEAPTINDSSRIVLAARSPNPTGAARALQN